MAANQGQFLVFEDYIQNPIYGFLEQVPWEKLSAIRANYSTQNIMEPYQSRDFFRIPLWRNYCSPRNKVLFLLLATTINFIQ
jgi:hypothetical protein